MGERGREGGREETLTRINHITKPQQLQHARIPRWWSAHPDASSWWQYSWGKERSYMKMIIDKNLVQEWLSQRLKCDLVLEKIFINIWYIFINKTYYYLFLIFILNICESCAYLSLRGISECCITFWKSSLDTPVCGREGGREETNVMVGCWYKHTHLLWTACRGIAAAASHRHWGERGGRGREGVEQRMGGWMEERGKGRDDC